jgi:hypothetical protein
MLLVLLLGCAKLRKGYLFASRRWTHIFSRTVSERVYYCMPFAWLLLYGVMTPAADGPAGSSKLNPATVVQMRMEFVPSPISWYELSQLCSTIGQSHTWTPRFVMDDRPGLRFLGVCERGTATLCRDICQIERRSDVMPNWYIVCLELEMIFSA